MRVLARIIAGMGRRRLRAYKAAAIFKTRRLCKFIRLVRNNRMDYFDAVSGLSAAAER
jgi:hypothetical protein